MPIVKGMIEECKTLSGEKNGKKWEKINVVILGREYGGWLPEWNKLRASEGKHCEIDYEESGKYKNIKDVRFTAIPKEAEMGEPPPPDRDTLIVRQNISTAAHTLVASMIGRGLLDTAPTGVALEEYLDTWVDHFYQAGLKRVL